MLSNLDTQRFNTMGTGVNAANAATSAEADPYNRILAAEAQRRGIPLSALSGIESLVGPLAQAFGKTNGTSETTTPTNWAQLGTGLAIAGIGAATGNPMAVMGGLGSVAQNGYANSGNFGQFSVTQNGIPIYGPGF